MSSSRFSFWAILSSSAGREWSLLRKGPPALFLTASVYGASLLDKGRARATSEQYREVQEGTMRAWIFQYLFFRS